MTVLEFMKKATDLDVDVDVGSDCTDWCIAYCADKDLTLTEEGRAEFSSVLSLEVEWEEGADFATIKTNHLGDKAEEMDERAKEFFYALAGYVSNSKYERWFNVAD